MERANRWYFVYLIHHSPTVCEDCNDLHHGDCPIHGPLKTLDPNTAFDEASKLLTSVPVPGELTVKTSSIANAGLGVFSKGFIPRGVKVGPYEGRVLWKDEVEDGTDTSYMWEVRAVSSTRAVSFLGCTLLLLAV